MKIHTFLPTSLTTYISALSFVLGSVASAATYNVGTTTDYPITTVNSTTGAIVSGTGAGQVTLRSAIIGANQNGVGPHTINVPAGTYNLSQANPNTPGTTATAGLNDLQAGSHLSTITIIGTGVTPKIVQTVAGNDVITTGFKSDGSAAIVTLTLTNLEITGGTYTGIFVGADDGTNRSVSTITNCNIHDNAATNGAFGQGGAIQHGAGSLSVSGTTFTNNSAPSSTYGQGGAIYFSLPNQSGQGSTGSLTISNCTFTSNTSAIGSSFPAGGAIFLDVVSSDTLGGAINITGCTFDSNLATGGGYGGAITIANSTALRTVNFLRNNFRNNQVTNVNGRGGAIEIHSGKVNINYNRFIGNTATTAANGRAIYHLVGNADPVSATDNWWTLNTGPAVNDVTGGTVTLTTWLQLRNIASPATIYTNQAPTSTLVTADILGRNSGGPIAASNLTGLPSFPVPPTTIFSNPVKGTLSSASTQFVNGQATVTFTAATGGIGGVDATADSQTITAPITVNQPPAITSANTTTFTTGTAGAFNVIATGYPSPAINLTSGSLPTGVNYANGTGSLAGTPAANTFGTYALVFTASNGIGSNAVQNFSLIVNPSAQEVKSKPTISGNPTSGFQVGFIGNPGTQYTIQFAPTLPPLPAAPNWQTLTTRTATPSGTFSAPDNPPAGTTQRFYRAIIP